MLLKKRLLFHPTIDINIGTLEIILKSRVVSLGVYLKITFLKILYLRQKTNVALGWLLEEHLGVSALSPYTRHA